MQTQVQSNRPLTAVRGVPWLSIVLVLLIAIRASAVSTGNGTLLVGNRFGQVPADVLSVDPTTGIVSGVWGDATDFNPAPGAMAQDSHGRVYILDTNRDRIQRFDVQGHFIDIFASAPLKVNGLYYGLAIDGADNVYVSSDGPQTFNTIDDAIIRFSPSGAYLGTFGQASNGSSGLISGGPLAFDSVGNLYTSSGGKITRYSPSGTYLGVFLNQFAAQLAFDSTGRLYTVGSEFNRFAADGTPLGAFVTGFDSGGLAIDRQDNVYLSDLSGDLVRKFSPSGALLATITSTSMDGPGNLLILVPEPAMATLIASIAVAGLFFRRKSSKTRPVRSHSM